MLLRKSGANRVADLKIDAAARESARAVRGAANPGAAEDSWRDLSTVSTTSTTSASSARRAATRTTAAPAGGAGASARTDHLVLIILRRYLCETAPLW